MLYIYICREAEKVVRQMSNNMKCKNPTKFLEIKILSTCSTVFSSPEMISHIKDMEILDNHRVLLIKKCINIFLKVRLHWEGKKASEKKEYVRQKLHKLILFKNQ